MKRTFFVALLVMILAGSCIQAQDSTPAAAPQGPKIEMYYFHTSFRCATCIAVEEQSKKAFEALYPDLFQSGEATFQAVNIEEKEYADLVDRYKISGQTLLVVKGDKTADLTSEGFLYAKTDPDKLKEAIRKTVDNL